MGKLEQICTFYFLKLVLFHKVDLLLLNYESTAKTESLKSEENLLYFLFPKNISLRKCFNCILKFERTCLSDYYFPFNS